MNNKNNPNIDEIYYKDQLVAHYYDLNGINETSFPTPACNEFQFGVGVIDQDKTLETHIHKNLERNIQNTSEFLYVISGKMIIEILSEDSTFIKKIELTDSQALLQFIGGHKISFDAGTKYFEIKQGPYLGRDADKFFIES
tara:strand:+ start:1322 stop:1744 length:423 start_codon:yes stop_codon:yes gene_type:complete